MKLKFRKKLCARETDLKSKELCAKRRLQCVIKARAMRQRCSNKNLSCYKNYGGRGISVCDEWKDSFESFYEWAICNGYKEGLSIERINNNGNYCPDNCKWIKKSAQANNRRRNKHIEYKGETHNLSEWCNILGVSYSLVHNRMNKLGWSFERAVETPCDINKSSRKGE